MSTQKRAAGSDNRSPNVNAKRTRGEGATDVAPGSKIASPPPGAFLAYPPIAAASQEVKRTAFQLPTQFTTFSYDENHTQHFDNSAMRYYVKPPPSARLDYGYERWIRQDDDRGRIDALLRALVDAKKDPSKAQYVPDNGVVCWRGMMTKILIGPYENRDAWDLNVMFVNGVLYLEEHATEAKLRERNDMPPRQRQQTYYGYSFESYCTSDTPTRQTTRKRTGEPPGWGGDVNTNVQWCSVVRTKLGDTRIVIGGEVDCVRGQYTGSTDTFVELKTSMVIRGPHDESKFEKKLLKFYFQSFLLGVPEIVVGFRTPAGVVTTIQSFKTIEIPRLVRGKPGAWDPLVCLDWGNTLLDFVKTVVSKETNPETQDASRQVWRLSFVPGTGVNVRLLGESDVDEVVNGEDRIGFLPRWYWEELHTSQESPPTSTSGKSAGISSQPGHTQLSPPDTLSGWKI